MNWNDAVLVMREGHSVRRLSEMHMTVLDAGNPELQGDRWQDGIEHAPIFESGQEGCKLMHAWTVDEKPVLVFMGSGSKCLFVPDDEDRGATDWVIESGKTGGG
ncbi:MAG: hypothetical protein V4451_16290 [Pseudomonadota bacterium]